MAEVNNCLLPDELKYHIEFNVWLRDNGDGSYDMGMTDIAQTMAGSVIHCRPKSVGKKVKKGKSVATVESGKWVGPVKTPLTIKVPTSRDGSSGSNHPIWMESKVNLFQEMRLLMVLKHT